jgi:hypothetical protein
MSNASNAFLAAIVAISISWPVLAQPRDNGRNASAAGTVKVLYAGSLVNPMQHGVGPAFDKATGNQFQGYAMGSHRLANQFQGYAGTSRSHNRRLSSVTMYRVNSPPSLKQSPGIECCKSPALGSA